MKVCRGERILGSGYVVIEILLWKAWRLKVLASAERTDSLRNSVAHYFVLMLPNAELGKEFKGKSEKRLCWLADVHSQVP